MLKDEQARRLAIERAHDKRRLDAMTNKTEEEIKQMEEAEQIAQKLYVKQLQVEKEAEEAEKKRLKKLEKKKFKMEQERLFQKNRGQELHVTKLKNFENTAISLDK